MLKINKLDIQKSILKGSEVLKKYNLKVVNLSFLVTLRFYPSGLYSSNIDKNITKKNIIENNFKDKKILKNKLEEFNLRIENFENYIILNESNQESEIIETNINLMLETKNQYNKISVKLLESEEKSEVKDLTEKFSKIERTFFDNSFKIKNEIDGVKMKKEELLERVNIRLNELVKYEENLNINDNIKLRDKKVIDTLKFKLDFILKDLIDNKTTSENLLSELSLNKIDGILVLTKILPMDFKGLTISYIKEETQEQALIDYNDLNNM